MQTTPTSWPDHYKCACYGLAWVTIIENLAGQGMRKKYCIITMQRARDLVSNPVYVVYSIYDQTIIWSLSICLADSTWLLAPTARIPWPMNSFIKTPIKAWAVVVRKNFHGPYARETLVTRPGRIPQGAGADRITRVHKMLTRHFNLHWATFS